MSRGSCYLFPFFHEATINWFSVACVPDNGVPESIVTRQKILRYLCPREKFNFEQINFSIGQKRADLGFLEGGGGGRWRIFKNFVRSTKLFFRAFPEY